MGDQDNDVVDFSAPSAQQQAAPAPADDVVDFSAPQGQKQAAPEQGMLDKEIPLSSYGNATLSGLQSVARGVRDAVKAPIDLVSPAKDTNEKAVSNISSAALPIYRLLRGFGHSAGDAMQLSAAIHDINQSADPVGTYAKAAQETAGQGAGQAMTAAATEGLIKSVPKVAGAAADAGKQVMQGADVVQPEVQAAARTAAGGAPGSLREVLSDPIAQAKTARDSIYDAYDKASGVNRQELEQRLSNTQDQISKLTGTPADMKKLARLQDAEAGLKRTLKWSDQRASIAGVDIDEANSANIRFRALQDLEKNVFKNQNVVEGNTAQGGAESINVDNAIKELQKMKDNEKFGGPRLDQALGAGNGDKLLTQLRQYQAVGVHAMKTQALAKAIGIYAGLPVAGAALGVATFKH
jgi:hypothetical protein